MIQDHKVTVFYTAPTAIRTLIKAGGELPKKYNLKSLRILARSASRSIEAWMWYLHTVGDKRCLSSIHGGNRDRRAYDHAGFPACMP